MPSVAPITAECPNHFTSLRWWKTTEEMLTDTKTCTSAAMHVGSFVTLSFGAREKKINFCSFLPGAFLFPFLFSAGLIFILLWTGTECLSIYLDSRDWSLAISFLKPYNCFPSFLTFCLFVCLQGFFSLLFLSYDPFFERLFPHCA